MKTSQNVQTIVNAKLK